MNCFRCMVERQKAFILISNRDKLSEILTNANLWHTANRIWTCREPEFRFSWMKLCSSDKHYTTHRATIITTTAPALCGVLGTSLLLCLYRLLVSFVWSLCILLYKFMLILTGTYSSSHEKKKWQSLHIFLKPRCLNVRYFEWTYWYSSIWLLLLCPFDLGLCQGDLRKISVDNDIKFSTSILCTKNN